MTTAVRSVFGAIKLRPFKVSILLFFLFFYLYGVHFTFLPTYTSRLILLGAFLYMAALFFVKQGLTIPFNFIAVGALYIVCLAWVLMVNSVYGLSDVSILASTLFLFFHSFLGGLFFAIVFRKMNFSFNQFIYALQIVIVLQAIFIVIYFISWDFREFTFAYIPEGGNINHRENLFRSRGLTHSSGASLSLVQSLGFLFTAYLVTQVRYKSKQFIYLLFSFGLIFLSVFLTGRTGLLMIPVALFYLVSILAAKRKLSKNSIYFMIGLPVAAFVLFMALRLGYQYILGGFSTAWGEDGFSQLVRWVLQEFISVDGQLQSRTAQGLLSHWFFPDSWQLFLFGDPTTWSLRRIPSDVGIIRLLHGIGFVGMVLTYALYALFFIVSIIRAKGFEAKLMLMLMALFLFLMEAKEPFLTSLFLNSFILIIFCFLVLSGGATNRQESNRA